MIRRQVLGLAAGAALLPCVRLSAQAAAAARPPARPADDFAALPFMDGPLLSPDGSRVASRVAIDGVLYFAIAPLFGGAKPSIVGSGDRDINWWRWVNDDWLVIGIGDTVKFEGEDVYVRRALGVSADATKMVPLAWREAAQGADDVVWIAGDGTPRVRLALQKSIYLSDESFWPEVIEVDVSNGKSKSVVRPHTQVGSWYADGSGTVRVGIGETNAGRSLHLLYRERDGQAFDLIERANSRKGQKLLFPSLFLPEPGQALAVDDRDGFDALYRLDLKTMSLGERVFAAPGYDIDSIVADRVQGKLLGVSVIESAAKMHWLDPDLAEMQRVLDEAVPGRQATIASMDKARERFLVHIGGADRPGAYFYVTALGGKLQRLAHVNPRIGTGKLHPVRTIRYKARDGLEIPAVLTVPTGLEAKNLPLVVMPHGGPFARDSEEWDWWSQFLADRGYAVVQPNYRGSSGYGTAFAEKGEGQWGLAMQDDLNDALAFLAKEGIADPKRAAMVGASYGGYAAMRAAQRDGALYRCAAAFAGVSDLQALLRYDGRFLNSGRGIDWLRKQAPNLREVSPVNHPEQFSIPILLVHGKKDQRVPVKQSHELAEKLGKAGKDVKYVEQPQGDHHFSRQADRLQFLTELEAFLKQHNPA